ncbi:MAG: hypothetical protein HC843_03375 [Sphingomonadales bacterium]|nr:hypothetical protein [Sphingomonadales bacterium]
MFKRLFTDHPASVDESYFEHFRFAVKFGLRMMGGGIGAMVHALIPGLCQSTGSNTIRTLNDSVARHREAKRAAIRERNSSDYII